MMCEINPKRKEFFRLEIFSTHPMTDETWNRLVTEKLLALEEAFNAKGNVRVHIHHEDEKE